MIRLINRGHISWPLLIVLGILFFLILSLSLLYAFRNQLALALIKGQLKKHLNADISIAQTQLDLFNRSLRVTGIEIGNPPGFQQLFSIRIPEFKIRLGSPMKEKEVWMISELLIDINEILIERNKQKKYNLTMLPKSGLEDKPKGRNESSNKKSDKKSQEDFKFKIATLMLRVNNVSYYDYSIMDDPPRIAYNVNINETLRDSHSISQIRDRILQRVLSKTPLKIKDLIGGDGFIMEQKERIKEKLTDKIKSLF
ncbi:MAG: hypothetical protein NZM04_03125 [Methylacidiphilales bacterium]|nr:hypothetical protein [Candidatus Methylacidiphilales bacterium]MDW8348725.1 hypothetical protein [Verrucomicrobiae bacterium]